MNNKLAAFKQPQSMAAFTNVPRQTEIMGQPHMLSYINPEEEAMLQQMRGGMPPVAGPGGVPAFWSLSGWANDTFGYKSYGSKLPCFQLSVRTRHAICAHALLLMECVRHIQSLPLSFCRSPGSRFRLPEHR